MTGDCGVIESTERELLRAYRLRGDQESFAELVRRFGGMVEGAARSVLGESNAAEDIAQATFIALARRAAELDDKCSLAGWLHKVAVLLARAERRGRRRRLEHEDAAIVIRTQRTKTLTFDGLAMRALHEELAVLPEKDRVPLTLFHLEGRSLKEASFLLGCNPKTFSARLVRAREKLRKRLVRRGVE